MSLKDLLVFLGLQLLTIPVVIGIFRSGMERKYAALVAGTIFLLLALFMILKMKKWSIQKTSFTFWAVRAHLLLTTVPLIVVRLAYFSKDFTRIRIGGIPAPQFHYYAEILYVVVIGATLLDLGRVLFLKFRSKK